MSLNRVHEHKLLGSEFTFPIGIDEAGRGPLAGPVTCGAVFIPTDIDISSLGLVADSKVMTELDRERTFQIVSKNPRILWDVSIVSHTEIDEINILQASLTGMRRATESVLKKMSSKTFAKETGFKFVNEKCIGLIDGNKIPSNMPIHSVFVIKGDSFIYSIAIASILAKVTRDRIMKQYDVEYPQYNFAQHKGYPTFKHRSVLHEIGPCPIHRITYGPVNLAIIAAQERIKRDNNILNKSSGKEEVTTTAAIKTEDSSAKKRKRTLTSAAEVRPSSSEASALGAKANKRKTTTQTQTVHASTQKTNKNKIRTLKNDKHLITTKSTSIRRVKATGKVSSLGMTIASRTSVNEIHIQKGDRCTTSVDTNTNNRRASERLRDAKR